MVKIHQKLSSVFFSVLILLQSNYLFGMIQNPEIKLISWEIEQHADNWVKSLQSINYAYLLASLYVKNGDSKGRLIDDKKLHEDLRIFESLFQKNKNLMVKINKDTFRRKNFPEIIIGIDVFKKAYLKYYDITLPKMKKLLLDIKALELKYKQKYIEVKKGTIGNYALLSYLGVGSMIVVTALLSSVTSAGGMYGLSREEINNNDRKEIGAVVIGITSGTTVYLGALANAINYADKRRRWDVSLIERSRKKLERSIEKFSLVKNDVFKELSELSKLIKEDFRFVAPIWPRHLKP